MRWLALDVGTRRVGVAMSDAEERVVTPLPALEWGGPEALARAVAGLVDRWDAGGVVVGLPVTRAGTGRGERRVAGVVAALGERLMVPVETADERGSTRAATALLGEAGVARRRWSGAVDSLAAKLVLEGFLALRREARGGREQR